MGSRPMEALGVKHFLVRNAKHEAASTAFSIFRTTRPGIELSLTASLARTLANSVPINGFYVYSIVTVN